MRDDTTDDSPDVSTPQLSPGETARLFVYGTLRGEGVPAVLTGFDRVADGEAFPTIRPSPGDTVEGELLDVTYGELFQMDAYEGHNPGDPERSLYWRVAVVDDPLTYVYVGNPDRGGWPVNYGHGGVHAAADTDAVTVYTATEADADAAAADANGGGE